MINTITVQGLTMGNGTDYSILRAEGLESPNVAVGLHPLGGRHGINLVRALWRERRVRFEIGIRGATVSSYATLRNDLFKAWDLPRGGNTVTVQLATADGKNLQFNAQISNPIEGGFTPGALTVGRVRVELIASANIVSQTENSTQITLPIAGGTTLPATLPLAFSVSGGSASITNNGNGIHFPTMTIYGPATNPNVRNSTLDKFLKVTYTLGASDRIEVDMENETVLLNGLTSLLDYMTGEFWWLAAGINSVSYGDDAGSPSSYVEIDYRDSYVGI